MFGHLWPTRQHTFIGKKTSVDFRGYLLLLGVAAVAALILVSSGRGPIVEAGYQSPRATVQVDRADQSITAYSPQSEVFRFALAVDRPGVYLEQLKFYVNGLYQADIFADLKLYHQGTQLGYVEKFDQEGNIYFSLDDYALNGGANIFDLILSGNASLLPGQALQFSLTDESSILLSYQGRSFRPEADYPLSGGLISVRDKGLVLAYNSSSDQQILLTGDKPWIAGFKLTSQGELVDLSEISFTYETDVAKEELSNSIFYLWQGEELISPASAQDGQISFDLTRPIVLGPDSVTAWSLQAESLAPGQYAFRLSSIVGKGFVSGQDLSLSEPLAWEELKVRPYYLSFTDLPSQNNLHEGWNQIFETQISSRGTEALELKRLTWALELEGAEGEALELWVDNKAYLTDLTAGDILRLDFDQPLVIRGSVNVKLLAKIKNLQAPARSQAYLLSDKEEEVSSESDNILWSAGENLYNSYSLPDLPLAPHVLTY